MNDAAHRLLVVSHPAVVSVNQEVYGELQRRGWDLTLVVPSRWRHAYSQTPIAPQALDGLGRSLRPVAVAFRGHPQRHLYLTSCLALGRRARADVAFIEAEPYALAATQWGRALARLGVPFGVQCYENIDRPLPAPVRRLRARVLRDAAFVAARSETAARLVRQWGARGEIGLAPPAVPAWEAPRAHRRKRVPGAGSEPGTEKLSENSEIALPEALGGVLAGFRTDAKSEPGMRGEPRAKSGPATNGRSTNHEHRSTGWEQEREEATGARASRPFTVGYAGRLVQSKGLLDLLGAVRQLRAPVELLLVGNGELRDQLEGQPIPGSRVRVLEGVAHDQMASAYAQLDVLALPSRTTARWKEQFGRVIVEALWCGVPVVGSDSGEIPWLIELTGGGLVFPEGDRDTLAARLSALRDSPELRRQLASRGRATVERLFTVPAAADSLERLLTHAAGGAGGAPPA